MTRSAKAQRALALGALCLIASGSAAHAQSGGASLTSDVTATTPTSTTPTVRARSPSFGPDRAGRRTVNAPDEVKRAIWWANRIVASPTATAVATSASTTRPTTARAPSPIALRGGNFVTSPLDSSSFMKWGERGEGDWITSTRPPPASLRRDRRPAPRYLVGVGEIRGQKGPRWRKVVLRDTKGLRPATHPPAFSLRAPPAGLRSFRRRAPPFAAN